MKTITIGEASQSLHKARKEYSDVDRKYIEKIFMNMKLLVCGIRPDEYNKIFACETVKEIWEAVHKTQEGTNQVMQSKINMLTKHYELFKMKKGESI